MTNMLVYFECPVDSIGTLMSAIGPIMPALSNLRMEPEGSPCAAAPTKEEEEAQPTAEFSKNTQPKTRRRRDLTTPLATRSRVARVVMDTLKTSPNGRDKGNTLRAALVDQGFSVNSLSPVVAGLVREGSLIRFGDDEYGLVS